MTMSPDADATKRPWEPMQFADMGRVSDVVLNGGGKLSIPSDDSGEVFRKPKGQE